MSAFHAFHQIAAAKNQASEESSGPAGPELRPENPASNGKGKFTCGCNGAPFRGRPYENTEAGWAHHIQLPSHMRWRAAEQGVGSAISAGPLPAAADMDWFKQDCTKTFKEIVSRLHLSNAAGKRLVLAKLTDFDLPWLAMLPEDRFLELYGLASAQVYILREVWANVQNGDTMEQLLEAADQDAAGAVGAADDVRPAHHVNQLAPISTPAKSVDELEALLLESEPRPSACSLDMKGRAICACASGQFHGHHYENSDAGWAAHIQQRSHMNWRRGELGLPPQDDSDAAQKQKAAAARKRRRA